MEERVDSREQEQYLDEALKRAGAFEEMVKTKGWELATAFYQNKVKNLMNELVNSPEKPIGEFEALRQEVIGLKKLFQSIEGDLATLQKFREDKANEPEDTSTE